MNLLNYLDPELSQLCELPLYRLWILSISYNNRETASAVADSTNPKAPRHDLCPGMLCAIPIFLLGQAMVIALVAVTWEGQYSNSILSAQQSRQYFPEENVKKPSKDKHLSL